MRHSLVRILFVCGVFAGFGAGCHDRLYDSGETISLVDGGLTHADAGSGGKIAAGDAGVGGATGAGGDTGAGGASNDAGTGTGGNSNLCDNNSPLRQTDVANCGTCFNQCYQMNADATCVAGACQYACLTASSTPTRIPPTAASARSPTAASGFATASTTTATASSTMAST